MDFVLSTSISNIVIVFFLLASIASICYVVYYEFIKNRHNNFSSLLWVLFSFLIPIIIPIIYMFYNQFFKKFQIKQQSDIK